MSCSDCQHLCRRKLAGSCMTTNNGGRTVNTQHIDTEAMLCSGAIEGPYRVTHPITLAWSERIRRAVVAWWGRHVMDPKVQD